MSATNETDSVPDIELSSYHFKLVSVDAANVTKSRIPDFVYLDIRSYFRVCDTQVLYLISGFSEYV